MRRLAFLCATTLSLCLTAAPLHAQFGGGMGGGGTGGMGGMGGMGGGRMGGRGGGGGWGRGEHRGGGSGGGFTLPTDGELQGPPAPATLRSLVDLTPEQLDRYAPLYAQYVAATQVRRDSATAALAALRQALDARDRDRMRQVGPTLRALAPKLEDEDRQFAEKTIRPLLTKAQRKTFDDWRERQKKAADEEREEFRREHRGESGGAGMGRMGEPQ
jgi:hypothetical protein